MIDPFQQYEYSAALHVHSTLSDGSGSPQEIIQAAVGAGVDVLWLTDHDTLGARRFPGEGYYGHTLFLVGAELSPRQNHVLALGTERLPASTGDWCDMVASVVRAGGLVFVAHPDDPGNRFLKIPSYRWTVRDRCPVMGLEIWNHLSQWSSGITGVLSALRAVAQPSRNLKEAPRETLREWDRLGSSRRVVGIGGVDAHAVRIGRWPLVVTVFPYRVLFRTLRTHIYTRASLTGDWQRDLSMLLAALAAGSASIVNLREGHEKGFRFWAETGDLRWPMGAETTWAPGMRLRGLSPVAAMWDIFCDGRLMGTQQGTLLDLAAPAAGVWRVALRRDANSPRVWIYSNPIYLRAATV
ncbi:MAG: phosphoesterase [Thermaerobacter sp.]|nr:phosphoesterase [Thermaerobacter sp.]